MDAEDTITVLGSLGTTVLPPRRDIGPCGEVYKPSLSTWNRYLKSQGIKMADVYVQKKNQAESNRLPPKQGAFYEAILLAQYQNDSLEQR